MMAFRVPTVPNAYLGTRNGTLRLSVGEGIPFRICIYTERNAHLRHRQKPSL